MKYFTARKRKQRITPAGWNYESELSAETEKVHGIRFSHIFACHFGDGTSCAVYDVSEWDRIAAHLTKRFFTEKEYLSSIYALHKERISQLSNLRKRARSTDLSTLSTKKLVDLCLEIKQKWLALDMINVYPWFVGADLFQEQVIKGIKKNHPNITDKEIQVLLTLPELSFGTLEELQILQATKFVQESNMQLESIEQLSDVARKRVKNLLASYDWIPFGYDGPTLYDEQHCIKEIKERLEQGYLNEHIERIQSFVENITQEQQSIQEKHKLSEEIIHHTEQLHLLAKLTDERKECQQQSHVALYEIHQELSKRTSISIFEIKSVFDDELKDLIAGKQEIREKARKRVSNPFIVAYTTEGARILTEKEAAQKKTELFAISEEDLIKGVVACKGKTKLVRGYARIIRWPHQVFSMRQGEILVTIMTTPEFLPAMKKAKAIIADEGGVTSHAATVSRELNTPCIIGAKKALRLLEDGDHIEINTETGVIKKI